MFSVNLRKYFCCISSYSTHWDRKCLPVSVSSLFRWPYSHCFLDLDLCISISTFSLLSLVLHLVGICLSFAKFHCCVLLCYHDGSRLACGCCFFKFVLPSNLYIGVFGSVLALDHFLLLGRRFFALVVRRLELLSPGSNDRYEWIMLSFGFNF